MSGVDVLAVMTKAEGLARRTCGLSGDPRARNLLKEVAESRAAVAELIEVAQNAATALEVAISSEFGTRQNPDVGRDDPEVKRLRAALTRVTGGSDGR